jgi:hypothetical protein
MLRSRDLGFEVRFVSQAVATHLGGDLESSPDLWSTRAVNRVRLHRRRNGRVANAAFLAASLVGEGARGAVGRPTCRRAFARLVRERPAIVTSPPPAPQPVRWEFT